MKCVKYDFKSPNAKPVIIDVPDVEPEEVVQTLEEQVADLAEYVDILSDFVLGGGAE